jgi:hypothetical protein
MMPKTHVGEKTASSINDAGKTEYSHAGHHKLDHYLS